MNREPADKIKVSPLYASFVIPPGEKSPGHKIGFIVDKNKGVNNMKEITVDEAFKMWNESVADRLFFHEFKGFIDYLVTKRRYKIV